MHKTQLMKRKKSIKSRNRNETRLEKTVFVHEVQGPCPSNIRIGIFIQEFSYEYEIKRKKREKMIDETKRIRRIVVRSVRYNKRIKAKKNKLQEKKSCDNFLIRLHHETICRRRIYIFVTFVINSYCIDQISILLNKLHNLKIIEE